jgi:hypothetical protein
LKKFISLSPLPLRERVRVRGSLKKFISLSPLPLRERTKVRGENKKPQMNLGQQKE